jgi:hypothetical protein
MSSLTYNHRPKEFSQELFGIAESLNTSPENVASLVNVARARARHLVGNTNAAFFFNTPITSEHRKL